jgi:hypothetical protein
MALLGVTKRDPLVTRLYFSLPPLHSGSFLFVKNHDQALQPSLLPYSAYLFRDMRSFKRLQESLNSVLQEIFYFRIRSLNSSLFSQIEGSENQKMKIIISTYTPNS